jgi:hypothetical protein
LHSHFSNLWINAQKTAPAIVHVAGAVLKVIILWQFQLLQKEQQLFFIFSHLSL